MYQPKEQISPKLDAIQILFWYLLRLFGNKYDIPLKCIYYEMRPRYSTTTVSLLATSTHRGILCEWFRPIAGTHQEGEPRPPCVLP